MYRQMVKLLPEEILVYLRKSRSDDPLLTIEEVLQNHERILREWIEMNLDGPIPEENWFREVVSGETIEKRVEFQKILRLIESPRYKAILCIDCSRLSRGDLMENGYILRILRYSKTMVLTRMESFDLQYESDRDRFERELKRGNEYLEYTKKTLYAGKELSCSRGWYIGSYAPYGYDKTWAMDGKRERPTLKINEEEAEVVRMIFDMYVKEGLGLQAIATRLDKMGIKPRNSRVFSRSTVRDIISNEHLTGKIVWKKRPINKVVENSEVITRRDFSDDVMIFEGRHEAIISEELFNQAREITNNAPKVNIDFKLRNPLAGIMYCKCGYPMVLRNARGKYRYSCKMCRNCDTASVDKDELIDAVLASIEAEIGHLEFKMTNSMDTDSKSTEKAISMLEKKLREYDAKEIALWDKYVEEGMPKAVFDKLMEKNEADKKRASGDIEALQKVITNNSERLKEIIKLSDTLEHVKYSRCSIENQNKLLKACIERIDYSREKSDQKKNPNDFNLEITFKV